MNSLLHRDSDDTDSEDIHAAHGEREITLGTTMILAIFFALAVFAAIFFGFGYSMGSRRAATAASATSPVAPLPAVGSAAKPAAGNPLPGTQSGPAKSLAADSGEPPVPVASQPAVPTPAHPAPSPQPAAASAPALPAAQQPVVQIAAVSHQEDANLLVSTLKRRGYDVAIRTDVRDKLLHVQIGPFPSHAQAEAMRQRLIADGFNAIVKDPAH